MELHTVLSLAGALLAAACLAFLALLYARTSTFQVADIQKTIQDENARSRMESGQTSRQEREELASTLARLNDSLHQRFSEMSTLQKNHLETFAAATGGQLGTLTRAMEDRLEKMKTAVAADLKSIREETGQRLNEMRAVVDEKLQTTIERRMGESFKLVSERLEQVHKGLGEMQAVAGSVGDLKNILSNVKTRGILGEIQLSALLEDILTPEQYAVNVATKPNSNDRVEFAVRLPGARGAEADRPLWLPIDAKFPVEDYQRLLQAREQGNAQAAEEAIKQLETRLRNEAKTIRAKYLEPPFTTDFGVLFLPTEGLYAEVLHRPGLWQGLQRDYSVVVAGPTALGAFLNSLQMGFRTLAIEKRTSEVWKILGDVKTEFTKFTEVLENMKKKLSAASNELENAQVRTRQMERKLNQVQSVSAAPPSDQDPAPAV